MEKPKIEIDSEHQYKLVSNPADLIGWEFCGALSKDEMEYVSETVADPHGSYAGQTLSISKSVVLRKPYFLMRKPNKSVMQEFMDKIKEQDIVLDMLLTEKREFEAKWKQSAVDLLNVKSSLKDVQRLLNVANGTNETQQERVTKMEQDIGKIRKEIGEARMREIIEEKPIDFGNVASLS